MRTRNIFMLFVAFATSMAFMSCNKVEIEPVSSPLIKGINSLTTYSNARSVATDPVNEWGEIISTSEGAARIIEWGVQLPNMHSKSKINTSTYNVLSSVEGFKAVGFAPSNSFGHIAFAMDEDNIPLISKVYELDDSGGTELNTSEINDLLDSDINADDRFPGTITLGSDLLDTLIEVSGANGLSVYNTLDVLEEGWAIDIQVRPYNGDGEDFGPTGSNGAKDCRVWVPAAIYGQPTPMYHPGHYRPCTIGEVIQWGVDALGGFN